MNANIGEVFEKVSALTLEDWAMMLVDPEEIEVERFKNAENVYIGTTEYRGPITASLKVLCTHNFCRALYESVLGDEVADTENAVNQCKDALREMVNVFLGNFLTEAYGPDVVFELEPPDVHDADPAKIEEFFANKSMYSLLADDEPIAVALFKD